MAIVTPRRAADAEARRTEARLDNPAYQAFIALRDFPGPRRPDAGPPGHRLPHQARQPAVTGLPSFVIVGASLAGTAGERLRDSMVTLDPLLAAA